MGADKNIPSDGKPPLDDVYETVARFDEMSDSTENNTICINTKHVLVDKPDIARRVQIYDNDDDY